MLENNGLGDGSGAKHFIFVVSDGSGETAITLMRALITQFPDYQGIYTRRYTKVDHEARVDKVLESARHCEGPVFVAYTLVNADLRAYIARRIMELGLNGYDLFNTLINELSTFLGSSPLEKPNKFHGVNEKYFKRMAAIEFTLAHDDGQMISGLHEADIVLVGVSRAGKTPLSIHLSLFGHKVVNIPLAKGVIPPKELEEIKQRKIVALTIDPSRLISIRKKRLTGLNVSHSEYVNPNAIMEEIEEANAYFRKHRRWPVIDVTNRSIEETAALVRDKVFGRDRLVN